MYSFDNSDGRHSDPFELRCLNLLRDTPVSQISKSELSDICLAFSIAITEKCRECAIKLGAPINSQILDGTLKGTQVIFNRFVDENPSDTPREIMIRCHEYVDRWSESVEHLDKCLDSSS